MCHRRSDAGDAAERGVVAHHALRHHQRPGRAHALWSDLRGVSGQREYLPNLLHRTELLVWCHSDETLSARVGAEGTLLYQLLSERRPAQRLGTLRRDGRDDGAKDGRARGRGTGEYHWWLLWYNGCVYSCLWADCERQEASYTCCEAHDDVAIRPRTARRHPSGAVHQRW